jgi:hypothetical protein
MSIDFNSLLTAEERKAVVTQRIQQMAVEAYQLTINKRVIDSQSEPNAQASLEIENNLKFLEQIIETYSEELKTLGDSN